MAATGARTDASVAQRDAPTRQGAANSRNMSAA
jgi:hypothetical protein